MVILLQNSFFSEIQFSQKSLTHKKKQPHILPLCQSTIPDLSNALLFISLVCVVEDINYLKFSICENLQKRPGQLGLICHGYMTPILSGFIMKASFNQALTISFMILLGGFHFNTFLNSNVLFCMPVLIRFSFP